MRIETKVASEAFGIIRRRPEKIGHITGMYLISLGNCEAGHAGRAAYFFLRYMDDLLDGDRKIDGIDPLSHTLTIRSQVASGNFTNNPAVVELGEYALKILDKNARPGDNPKQDMLESIDAMIFDNERMKTRRALTKDELIDYYRHTFYPIHNILLTILKSQLRAEDIGKFCLSHGRVLSVEHLEDDWNKGIINIPDDVLEASGLTPDSPYLSLAQSPVVRNWNLNQLQQSEKDLLELQARLKKLPEKLTSIIYGYLVRSMLKNVGKLSGRDGET